LLARCLFVALLLPLLISSHLQAKIVAQFERDSFRRVSFSKACLKPQWSSLPDDSLELQFAPSPEEPCEVTLEFQYPLRVRRSSALAFEVRGVHAGATLRVGFQERPDGPWILSHPFPPSGLTRHWNPDGVRISRLREGWMPGQVSTLRFIALPYPATASGAPPTIFLRTLQWLVVPTEDSEQTPPPSALSTEPVPVVTQSPAEPAPVIAKPLTTPMVAARPRPIASNVHVPWQKYYPLRKGTQAGLAIGLLGLLYFLVKPKRSSDRRIISPLYEINTRTWKSRRDREGVVELGGFKNISFDDLKDIKDAGFNAIWLMGIWEIGPKVRDISRRYGHDYAGSPFAISDYRVSTDLGTEEEFYALVQRAHRLRLSVIVDFVPNHMGIDTPWLNDHPEYFIHKVLGPEESYLSNEELEKLYPGYFAYRTPAYPVGDRRLPKTIMVAYGKDPYFFPWIDTAQLDYAHAGLRRKMIDVLKQLAKHVDGVRCDMAMLVLREQVKAHRHPTMDRAQFDQRMPNEFWSEATSTVKSLHPHFTFMAETYWSLEGYLQQLGFDYTYNKPLYEAICNALHSGHADGLVNFLRMLGSEFLEKGVHFLENHDEERAMNVLGEERQRAAAAILSTLPGVALLYQGQLEGKRERLPVQRVIPLHREPENISLRRFYRGLLKGVSLPLFQEGRLTVLYSNNPALITYARVRDGEKALVVINASSKVQKGSVFISPWLRLKSGIPYRLTDLFYHFKPNEALEQSTVRPYYIYPASQIINEGLYIELQPFDGHIFLLEPNVHPLTQRLAHAINQWTLEWPVNRLARRIRGLAYSRSSDRDAHQSV
jgi:glycosidase